MAKDINELFNQAVNQLRCHRFVLVFANASAFFEQRIKHMGLPVHEEAGKWA